MRLIATGVALICCAELFGCASFSPPPVEGPVAMAAGKRGLSETRIAHGRELYVTACVECHRPVRPDSFSEENWDDILPKMVKRAKLDAAAHEDVRAYVFSARDAMLAEKTRQK
jgi:mono/diheme cytochrome c family protein